MPIQIIPKAKEKEAVFPNVVFYLSLTVFLIVVAGYFVINNMNKKTENEIQQIDQETAQLDASPQASLEKSILDYQKRINDLAGIMKNREYTSQIFPFIEQLAHPNVSFSSFGLAPDGVVTLVGTGDSFQTVEQQLMIFENEKRIDSVELSNVSQGDKGVSFTFNLTLNPSVFSQPIASLTASSTVASSTTATSTASSTNK